METVSQQQDAQQPSTTGKTPMFQRLTTYIVIFAVAASFAGGMYAEKARGARDGNTQSITVNKEEGGTLTNTDRPLPKYLTKDVDFMMFWDVWNRAKKDYIKKDTPDTKLFYGALAGIVSSLHDPYSVFLDPDTAKEFNDDLSGEFEGIGAEIGFKSGQLVVIAPLPGTPAEKAGLRAGDKILAIDKKNTSTFSLEYAVSLIRGKKGTDVVLKIFRDGEKEARDLTITRNTIAVDSVKWEMKKDDVAYIKITSFAKDTEGKFGQAVRELLPKNPKGLIIDLRNNPGGFLDTAVQVSGYWVDGKTVVIEEYGDGKRDPYSGTSKPILKDMKTIILVDGGSASASEILSGALQDYGKATLVGKKTFGKGSVQDLQQLKDGSAIKLTIAHWLTPLGRSINEEGIKPDVEVGITPDDIEKKKDPQLDKAMSLVTGEEKKVESTTGTKK